MSTTPLCNACVHDATSLKQALRRAEQEHRDGQQPDLSIVEALKHKLATRDCGCWTRRNVLPPPAPRQAEPKPAPQARPKAEPAPSPRLRLKGTGRPLKPAPPRDVLDAAIRRALDGVR